MKKIELTKGEYAIVDDEDFEELGKYKWHYLDVGYAARTVHPKGGKKRMIYMHREILKVSEQKSVDHINRDSLDNRKENLRLADNSLNGANRPKQQNNTSGYKGVCWSKNANKWMVRVGRKHYVGIFSDISDAVSAYNRKAQEIYGDFALLN